MTPDMREPIKALLDRRCIPVPEAGCWLWTGSSNETGYGDFKMARHHCTTHRASFYAYKGDIPDGAHILHSCDTRLCCNPDHLRAGTNRANIIDALRRGRKTELSEEKVLRMREFRVTNSLTKTAREFGVSMVTACFVVTGRTWKFVGGPITPAGLGPRERNG